MIGINDPIVDHDAREITVIVLEKKDRLYAAAIGHPRKDKPRNWGHKNFWGDGKWDDSRDRENLWRKVRDAVKADDRYGRNWTVKFRHRFTEDRREQLGWNIKQCDDRASEYDREANRNR